VERRGRAGVPLGPLSSAERTAQETEEAMQGRGDGRRGGGGVTVETKIDAAKRERGGHCKMQHPLQRPLERAQCLVPSPFCRLGGFPASAGDSLN
jgi:hypothetical protein